MPISRGMEEWKTIEGFEDYEVSNLGNIKSNKQTNSGLKGRLLKPGLVGRPGEEYNQVVLCKDGFMYPRRVHQLVGKAFLPNSEGKRTIDHINQIKLDNRIENLRWATDGEQSLNRRKRTEHPNIYKSSSLSYYVRIRRNNKAIFMSKSMSLEEAIFTRDAFLSSLS